MIQPDANADSPNEVSAGKDARDEPLSLPPDEVGEIEGLIAALRSQRFSRSTWDENAMAADREQLDRWASTLSRLLDERDELNAIIDFADVIRAAEREDRLKAEDANRKLVEGLRRWIDVKDALAGDSYDGIEPAYVERLDAIAAESRSLLSSISGGEGKQ